MNKRNQIYSHIDKEGHINQSWDVDNYTRNYQSINKNIVNTEESEKDDPVSQRVIIRRNDYSVGINKDMHLIKNTSSIKDNPFDSTKKLSEHHSGHTRVSPAFKMITWEDSSTFIGMYLKSEATGLGQLQHSSGFIYQGSFKKNKANGYGIFDFSRNNEWYEGEWLDDAQHGIGRELLKHSHKYEGTFVKGNKNGIGVFTWKNGSFYLGEWRQNMMNGFGIHKYNNGCLYQGEWKNNVMHGYGEFFWNDGKKYIGNFGNDHREGIGILYIDTDEFYISTWRNGKQHGLGKNVSICNKTKYGVWNEGRILYCFDTVEEV